MTVYIAEKNTCSFYQNMSKCLTFVFFTRVLSMNIIMYRVMNADIPEMYMGVNVHIHAKYVIRLSVKKAVW